MLPAVCSCVSVLFQRWHGRGLQFFAAVMRAHYQPCLNAAFLQRFERTRCFFGTYELHPPHKPDTSGPTPRVLGAFQSSPLESPPGWTGDFAGPARLVKTQHHHVQFYRVFLRTAAYSVSSKSYATCCTDSNFCNPARANASQRVLHRFRQPAAATSLINHAQDLRFNSGEGEGGRGLGLLRVLPS